ncbi:hypothetical protein ACFQ9X_09985 [Catenulispora yoronensis]
MYVSNASAGTVSAIDPATGTVTATTTTTNPRGIPINAHISRLSPDGRKVYVLGDSLAEYDIATGAVAWATAMPPAPRRSNSCCPPTAPWPMSPTTTIC